jgi:hypothetical protein
MISTPLALPDPPPRAQVALGHAPSREAELRPHPRVPKCNLVTSKPAGKREKVITVSVFRGKTAKVHYRSEISDGKRREFIADRFSPTEDGER